MSTFNKYVVTARKVPTAYNDPVNYVVEAASEDDAILIVKHQTRDLSNYSRMIYEVKDYIPPPAGKIISSYY